VKTLALQHGDLVLASSGHRTLDGASKVLQDLRGALLEPMGTDRFHPAFGSVLGSHVGEPISEFTGHDLRAEVQRVVDAYAGVQRDRLERDALSGRRSRYKTDDVLANLQTVSTRQMGDRIYLQVVLRTAADTSVTLNTSVGA
jgi:hypothetical protein